MATPTAIAEQNEVRRKGRRRLIGAVAIVLLAVVFVPMVLDPEPRRVIAEQSLAIPAKEGAAPLPAPTKSVEPAKPAEKPVDLVKADTPAPAPAPAKVAQVEAKPDPTPTATPAKTAPAAPAKPAPAAVAAAPAAAPKLAGFAIQVGAFRDEEKLRIAREKLVAAKVPHFTERLAAGDLTRLRAGPYPTREAAEKAVASVKLAGLEGKVVTLP